MNARGRAVQRSAFCDRAFGTSTPSIDLDFGLFFFFSFISSSTSPFATSVEPHARTHKHTQKTSNKQKKHQPVTITVNNKSIIPQIRGWEPAPPLSALNATKLRAAAIANATVSSPNPLGTLVNETKATVRGKSRYVQKTLANAIGKGNVTTLLNAVNLGAGSSVTDLTCVVDPKTGALVGLTKPGTNLCMMTGNKVTVPTSKAYISQIKVRERRGGSFDFLFIAFHIFAFLFRFFSHDFLLLFFVPLLFSYVSPRLLSLRFFSLPLLSIHFFSFSPLLFSLSLFSLSASTLFPPLLS